MNLIEVNNSIMLLKISDKATAGRPAFASFGPPTGGFKNEYDSGEQFSALIRRL